MQKSLDQKLAAIHADPSGSREFILADAKDADMAYGVGAPGKSPERHDGEAQFRTLAEYRQHIRDVVGQQIVDVMLMSAGTAEKLVIEERLFDDSPVTPAARANDASDIHLPRGGRFHTEPSRPFRTARIDHIQCGRVDCEPAERTRGVDLGLYSITFNNHCEFDLETLRQYKAFREEAERKGFRHFLEIFDPNLPGAVAEELTPGFVNDLVARTLAGVTSQGRPLFLKMVYHGPRAMEELVRYDPHLIVGVLGGAAGTTLDAFQLLYEAKKYGARAALFGRKINQAENQLAFIEFLRHVADGVVEPAEAVRAYHAVLEKLNVRPNRPLDEDLTLQTGVMSYAGRGTRVSLPGSTANWSQRRREEAPRPQPGNFGRDRLTASGSGQSRETAAPDFAAMTSEQRLAYHRARLDRMFGE